MHTTKYSTPARRAGAFKHKLIAAACAALALATAAVPAKAASVLWVSDTTPLGFSGAGGNNLTDAGFVRLLESAGHTVARWNSPDAQATRLSAGDLATVNGYDLVIMGRAGASGQHQFPQSLDWNTGITKPLICMSPYFVRPDGGRLGWFTGGTLPDTTPTALTAGDSNDPAVDFLFGGVTMNGLNTVDKYDELIDRNTSLIQNAPVAGGIATRRQTSPPKVTARRQRPTQSSASLLAHWFAPMLTCWRATACSSAAAVVKADSSRIKSRSTPVAKASHRPAKRCSSAPFN